MVFGAMAYFGATLTLPGIAGIVLTMGMAVDANVLIFERIREELAAGRTVKAAIAAGLRQGVERRHRHPHDHADLRALPVPVRHRSDPRVRGDLDRWA